LYFLGTKRTYIVKADMSVRAAKVPE